MILQSVLKEAKFSPSQCAGLLGISPKLFEEWVSGQRIVPRSYALTLSSVLGVPAEDILVPRKPGHAGEGDMLPAIWFKLREPRLSDADRECVLLTRHLGHLYNELEEVTGKKLVGWRSLFNEVRDGVDFQAPPREQGRQAARLVRSMRSLDSGKRGIGDVLRMNLRSAGILVIESPVPHSSLEGCCFFVGAQPNERPCIFANTYKTTWFRRNAVLAHELAHSLFEGKNTGASLDFLDSGEGTDIPELRANAFAQELLAPTEVLKHAAQSRGYSLATLHPESLAWLVAETHVEQRLIAQALVDAGIIDLERASNYRQMDIAADLRKFSDHSLSSAEYLSRLGGDASAWLGKRSTTIPSKSLRLPVPYVTAVVSAHDEGTISRSRASELLMIEESDFVARFSEHVSIEESDE